MCAAKICLEKTTPITRLNVSMQKRGDKVAFLTLLVCTGAYAGCAMRAHVVCLAQLFLHDQPQQLIPTTAPCPVCKGSLTWGAVVVERQKRKRHKLSSLNITF